MMALQQELESENASDRARSADELGRIGAEAASYAPSLALLLNDPVEATALNAAYALGHLGTQGIEMLIKQITEGSNLTAERAAYGLQGAGIGAIPELFRVMKHEDEKRRALAVFVLGMIGSSEGEVVPSLISSLQDQSEWVRRNAVESLGMLKNADEQVVTALAKVLKDSLRSETDGTAELIPTDSKKSYVSDQPYITNKVGYTAALSLLRTGNVGDVKEAVRSLEQALYSKDRYVRAYAAETLTHLRTDEAVDILIRYYRTSRWCPDTSKASTF
ncbi:HEAT repeat domain-containing protein, partial [Paenibacillus sp. TAF58]